MSAVKSRELALAGGAPAVTMPAPRWPVTGKADEKRMAEVVRSGNWSWLGVHERAFCEEYARFIGGKYCVCLANGTVTIQCALQAVGVVPGDEVIVPGMTWVATAQAALDVGANVVLADIDPETLCIDPNAIEKAVSLVLDQGLRTGAIWSQGCTKVGTQEMGDAVVAALRNL